MIRGKLTGNVRFRHGLTAIVLQVEYRWHGMAAHSRRVGEHLDWRDAETFDLADEALSWLVRPRCSREPQQTEDDAAAADFTTRRAERFSQAEAA